MPPINTIHDLRRLLQDSPEWKEKLREIYLTDESADLSQKLAEFAEERMETKNAYVHNQHNG